MCLNPLFYLNPKQMPYQIFVSRIQGKRERIEDYINEKGFLSPLGRESLHSWEFLDLNEFMQELPCRKCLECRMRQAREWTARCILELSQHKYAWFVTLTYDDQHAPFSSFVTSDFKCGSLLTLRYRDFQLFMKRLRKAIDYPIRYRVCPEYGDRTRRPHYHVIIFGLQLTDIQYLYSMKGGRKVWQDDRSGQPHYTSPWLRGIWQNGNIDIAAVDYGSIHYVSNYMLKAEIDALDRVSKEVLLESYQQSLGSQAAAYPYAVKLGVIELPAHRQSCRPAIGRAAYPEVRDQMLLCDELPAGYDLRVTHIRYFDRLFFEEFPALKNERLRTRANLAKAVAYDPKIDPDIQCTTAWKDEQRKRRGERLAAKVRLKHRPL